VLVNVDWAILTEHLSRCFDTLGWAAGRASGL